ncbi:MAG: YicC family protein [Zoogloeaceae bacterium]|nr:YicC family protein [Zoogloeaceae bacterium]
MINSMTGYAAQTRRFTSGQLHMELKGVNSRFLDLHFRLADELRAAEPDLREQLTARLKRGKVECRLYFTLEQKAGAAEVDPAALEKIRAIRDLVRAHLPEVSPLSLGDVLRWPALLCAESVDADALQPVIQELLRATLDEFSAARAREGEKLAALILERGQQMRAILSRIAPLIPAAQTALNEKLRQRLENAVSASGVSIDGSRILQEVALFAARIDVDEELSRLVTHLDELERIFATGGAVGKRLDFLMQELNREANTLSAKSALTEVTQAAMELKLLIEQMREQAQNLE